MTFVHNGGLERARELQIQELKEQERRTLDVERRAAYERGRTNSHAALNLRPRPGWSAEALIALIANIKKDSTD